jgi:hypothetical protein
MHEPALDGLGLVASETDGPLPGRFATRPDLEWESARCASAMTR